MIPFILAKLSLDDTFPYRPYRYNLCESYQSPINSPFARLGFLGWLGVLLEGDDREVALGLVVSVSKLFSELVEGGTKNVPDFLRRIGVFLVVDAVIDIEIEANVASDFPGDYLSGCAADEFVCERKCFLTSFCTR